MLVDPEEDRKIRKILDHIRAKPRPLTYGYSIFAKTQLYQFLATIRKHARESGFDVEEINYDLLDLTCDYPENLKILVDAGFPVTKPEKTIEERKFEDLAREYSARHTRFLVYKRVLPRTRREYRAENQKVIVTRGKAGIRIKVIPA